MTPSPLTRALPYILGASLLVALGFGLRPKPAPVETAIAAPGSLRATVSEEGKTRIRQRYVVSSPVTGQTYAMTCGGTQPVLCTGGVAARVVIYGGRLVIG